MSDGIRNHPAPEGRELGKTLAKWRDEAEEEIDDANHGMVVDDLWRVCWLAEFECEGKIEPFVTRRGEPVTRHETERRVAWGRQTYPWIIYWIEPDAGRAALQEGNEKGTIYVSDLAKIARRTCE